MVRYIGTKLIEAIQAQKDGKDGYKVIYPDGYTSSVSADVLNALICRFLSTPT